MLIQTSHKNREITTQDARVRAETNKQAAKPTKRTKDAPQSADTLPVDRPMKHESKRAHHKPESILSRVAKALTWTNLGVATLLGLVPRGANAQMGLGNCPPLTTLVDYNLQHAIPIRRNEPRDPAGLCSMQAMAMARQKYGPFAMGFCTPPVPAGNNFVYNFYRADMWFCSRS